jgi:hypothetical protein
MSMSECIAELKIMMRSPSKMNGKTVFIMKRIRYILENKKSFPDVNSSDVGMDLHNMMRIFRHSPKDSLSYFLTLWGAPGMTEYLMNEGLCCKAVTTQQAKYPNGYDFDHLPNDEEAYWLAWLAHDDTSAYQFSYLLFNIFIYSTLSPFETNCSIHDGKGTLLTGCDTLVGTAAQRAVDLFLDQHTRKSCGDAMAPGSSFILTLLTQMETTPSIKNVKLDILKVVKTCYAELSEEAASGHYAVGILNLPRLHTLFRRRFQGLALGGMPSAADDSDVDIRIRCELLFESYQFLQDIRNVKDRRKERTQILAGVDKILTETMRCSASERLQVLLRVGYRTNHTVVLPHIYKVGHWVPLEKCHSDSNTHTFAVFVLAKLMRDAFYPLQTCCKGGFGKVLGSQICADKSLLMHIALYAVDTASLTLPSLAALLKLSKKPACASENRPVRSKQPVPRDQAHVLENVPFQLLFAKPHIFCNHARDMKLLVQACIREALPRGIVDQLIHPKMFVPFPGMFNFG